MKSRTLHKALSMLLTAAMVLNMGLLPALAKDTPTDAPVLTECHIEHDSDCGYEETITTTACTHVHTGDCGYTVSTPEQPCNFVSAADATETHRHDESCGYAPAAEGTPCTHSHDETCGYSETVEVTNPCKHSCKVCNPGDQELGKVCTCEPALDASDSEHGETCPLYEKPVCICPPVEGGELVHGKDCPLNTAPVFSEAVKALIVMEDALPNADAITDENQDAAATAYKAATAAYEALSGEDKATFEATEQHTKLRVLQGVLFGMATMAVGDNVEVWRDGKLVGTYASFDKILTYDSTLLKSGDTLKLLNDVRVGISSLTISSKAGESPVINVNLDGNTVILDYNKFGGRSIGFHALDTKTFNIFNGKISYYGGVDGDICFPIQSSGGTINLENVDISIQGGGASKAQYYAIRASGGVVNAKNCIIDIYTDTQSNGNITVFTQNDGTVNIIGGEYRSDIVLCGITDAQPLPSINYAAHGEKYLILEGYELISGRDHIQMQPGTELVNSYKQADGREIAFYARTAALKTFSGKVNLSGVGVANATITATDANGNTVLKVKSGADGSFTNKLLPGTYTVKIVFEDYPEITDTITITDHTNKEYHFMAMNKIIINVSQADGTLFEGAIVTAKKGDNIYAGRFADGVYSINVPEAGSYAISVSKAGYRHSAPIPDVTFTIAQGETKTITVEMVMELIYNIFTKDKLVAFSQTIQNGIDYSGSTVHLRADIDMSGVVYKSSAATDIFKGTFDGNGHIIKNLSIFGDYRNIGFFSELSYATIRNLGLVNYYISSTHQEANAGGIAGVATGSVIENCFVSGRIGVNIPMESTYLYNGGLAGRMIG